MSADACLFESDSITVNLPVPCADQPNLVQLTGQLKRADIDEWTRFLGDGDWRTLKLGDPPSLMARDPQGRLLTIDSGNRFSLSRLDTIEVGLAILRKLTSDLSGELP